jgi:transcriptional regulator with XRE-family HTH domain
MTLADYMGKNNLDDDAMASLVGSDRSTISRIRRGKTKPSWDLVDRILDATDRQVTPNDYIGIAA